MPYQLDQSGRLEYTSQDTVLAIANSKKKTILIKAKEKRFLQQVFRTMGKNKQYAIRTFSIMIYYLIKTNPPPHLIIDLEYPGWEDNITSELINLFKRNSRNFNPHSLEFKAIGKSAEAHWQAYHVFKRKRRPNIIITAKEILNEVYQ